MKKTIITLSLLLFANFAAQAKLFTILNVTPEEFIACHGNNDDLCCRAHILMGCSSFCSGQNSENPALQRACQDLCQQPTTIPIAYKPEDESESESPE
jgi:hypothetical protein